MNILRNLKISVVFSVLINLPIGFCTSFYPQPFPKAVNDAPVIVKGRIGNQYSDWGKSESDSKTIYTYHELQVDEVLKGKTHGHSVQVREMGGEKDGVGLHISGTAEFKNGEEVVLFLKTRSPEGAYPLHGMMMGKLTFTPQAEGDPILSGPALFSPIRNSDPNSDQPPHQVWTLNDLRKLIREQDQQTSTERRPSNLRSPLSGSNSQQNLISPQPASTPAPPLQIPALEDANGFLPILLFSGLGLLVLGWSIFLSKNYLIKKYRKK